MELGLTEPYEVRVKLANLHRGPIPLTEFTRVFVVDDVDIVDNIKYR